MFKQEFTITVSLEEVADIVRAHIAKERSDWDVQDITVSEADSDFTLYIDPRKKEVKK